MLPIALSQAASRRASAETTEWRVIDSVTVNGWKEVVSRQ